MSSTNQIYLPLFPYPKHVEFTGESFVIDNNIFVKFDDNNILDLFKLFLPASYSLVEENGYKVDCRILNITSKYELKVSKSSAIVTASDNIGILYGLMTFSQLLTQDTLKAVVIKDSPSYDYRGFMLDVSRYFFDIDFLKKCVNLMAYLKLNNFHIHLSDDQGYRLESKVFPLLTTISTTRKRTLWNCKKHGGYYTHEEIKELVLYAKSLGITIIPEIDVPGHVRAILAAYPNLACIERSYEVAYKFGIKHDVFCLGKEEVYDFTYKLIDEICEVFDTKIIHLGGDEAPSTRWQYCPKCNKVMKDNNYDSYEMHQAHYTNKLKEHLTLKGIKFICWNESKLSNILDMDIITQLWDATGTLGIYKEIDKGRKAIVSDSIAYYLDLPYGKISLQKSWNYDYLSNFTDGAKNNILGIESCLWTELIPNEKVAWKKALPRILASSEHAWNSKNHPAYENISQFLPLVLNNLREKGYKAEKPCAYNPRYIRKLASNIWWDRRKLYWEGLNNLIDNAKAKKILKNENKKSQ